MSLHLQRKQARERALTDFLNPEEPWTAEIVREHLRHVRDEAEADVRFSASDRLALVRAETDAYCEEFTRLWNIRKAQAARRHAA